MPAIEFLKYRGVNTDEIPNIDLYMDQVLTFFDEFFGIFRRDQKENILTKAMINNYVKSNTIEKPMKKKYNKDQLKKLIMIYQIKQVMAINDIQALFDQVERLHLTTAELYDRFLKAEQASYGHLAEQYSHLLPEKAEGEELINTILSLTSQACAQKRLAEKLLDHLNSSQA